MPEFWNESLPQIVMCASNWDGVGAERETAGDKIAGATDPGDGFTVEFTAGGEPL